MNHLIILLLLFNFTKFDMDNQMWKYYLKVGSVKFTFYILMMG